MTRPTRGPISWPPRSKWSITWWPTGSPTELGVEEEIWFLEYHQPQLAIWRKGAGEERRQARIPVLDRPIERVAVTTDHGQRTTTMTMHAMPVMLGVLAILAIAYRYYSAFLAARVAALDDSRVTPGTPLERRPELRPDQPLGAVRPPFRGDLGCGSADRAGAGDPVRLFAGPGLAGGGRLPGREPSRT